MFLANATKQTKEKSLCKASSQLAWEWYLKNDGNTPPPLNFLYRPFDMDFFVQKSVWHF
jgi:hypothetical protein